jgi:hypothetical protein
LRFIRFFVVLSGLSAIAAYPLFCVTPRRIRFFFIFLCCTAVYPLSFVFLSQRFIRFALFIFYTAAYPLSFMFAQRFIRFVSFFLSHRFIRFGSTRLAMAQPAPRSGDCKQRGSAGRGEAFADKATSAAAHESGASANRDEAGHRPRSEEAGHRPRSEEAGHRPREREEATGHEARSRMRGSFMH